MNKYFKYTLLLFIALIGALFLVEGLSRLVFDPIDFLKPKTLSDETLRYRLEPNSGAHDSWGYRNKNVPESVDIVTIGDSHTYGISATASNSWPNQLAAMANKDVYNLSLGGYGPAEYLYLMEEMALKLNPEQIVVGFYLGNDLKDSLKAVYTVPNWEDLRSPENKSLSGELKDKRNIQSGGFSDWLSGHSVLYRIVSSSFIGDNLRQNRRLQKGEEILMLESAEYGINTGFTPDRRLKGLDLGDPKVREGLKLSLEFFNKMNNLAQENEIDFLVVIIPTKETVFSDIINTDDDLSKSNKIRNLILNESVVNKVVKAYFEENNIPYVDVLEPLREAALSEQIYPNNFGGHSNKNGYRIIAESVSSTLRPNNSQ